MISSLHLPIIFLLQTCTFTSNRPLPSDYDTLTVQLTGRAHGVLQSPNFPAPYPPEKRLHWNVTVPNGFHVRLYFSHFDLEPSYLCEYDYVKVDAEGKLQALYCGQEATDTESVPSSQVITSPRNFLSLLFVSDFSNEELYTGFRAHYSAEDVDECSELPDDQLLCNHYCHNYIGGFYCSCRYGYLLDSDNKTCKVECSNAVFQERSGVLHSVDFPFSYPKSLDCVYRIEVEPGLKLYLEFDPRFDVEDHPDISCPYDHIKVEAGSKVYGPFCGDRAPEEIQTESHIATIFFHSDNSGENEGWRLSYTSIGIECLVPKASLNTILQPIQTKYFFQDRVLVSCEPGYQLLQEGQILDYFELNCQASGFWSSYPPPCRMVDCGTPPEIDAANLVLANHDNNTKYGAQVHYICKDGHNSTYICGPAGVWVTSHSGSRELPRCQSACGRPAHSLPAQVKRIVGGQSAGPGLFPWQVLLSVKDQSRVPDYSWFGSGALLTPRWVLTAAHVLLSQRRDASVVPVTPENVQAFLGLHNASDRHLAITRPVERVVLHPDFRPDNYNNDIALLRLNEQVALSKLVHPVCLPQLQLQEAPFSPLPNSLGVVAGWGISSINSVVPPSVLTSSGVTTSDLLQYVRLPVVTQEECQASYASRSGSYNITENMFCAGFFQGGHDTCLGDSGGAFVMEDEVTQGWAVFGLVSWGGPEECGSQRVYGVYTRVAKYVPWIEEQLRRTP